MRLLNSAGARRSARPCPRNWATQDTPCIMNPIVAALGFCFPSAVAVSNIRVYCGKYRICTMDALELVCTERRGKGGGHGGTSGMEEGGHTAAVGSRAK